MLRLQFPRHLFGGEQRYLYLGLPDTPINRTAAEARAQVIMGDIAFDRFDPTLERYRPTAIQPDNSPPLGELWEKYKQHKTKSLAHSTIDKDFKRVANHISSLPSQRLRDASTIRKYLINTLTPASAKKVLMYLSACCQWALDEEIILHNPFEKLPKVGGKKSASTINPFSKAEMNQIISAFDAHPQFKHYAPFVKFLFLTGCRTSEAIGLQWRHISPDLKTITFSEALVIGQRKGTKTGGVRKFPINESLRSLLGDIKPVSPSPEALIFTSQSGTTIDAHNFLNRAWKTVISELPIVYRPQYNTRHTFITLCLESGIQVAQVAQWVGNSPKTIWQHYAGIAQFQDVPEL
ncbi:tyrosine-type recombinase/integrase [Cyanobacteria bacterium FACHB-472]|nr:tyrosine-type recombinase/integrase [Cyanobacteria bacterium FACHB-472]